MSVFGICGCGATSSASSCESLESSADADRSCIPWVNKAVPIVERRMGTAVLPLHARRLDRLDHMFIDHDLKAAAVWANVRAQLRGRRG